MHVIKKLGMLLVICASLQGCMNMAMSGAQAVYNRHSIQKDLNDQYINLQAYKAFNDHPNEFKNANIAISTFHAEVLLAGQVPSTNQRLQAEALVKTIPDVEAVHNFLSIASPSSSLTRMSDAWITTKIKSKYLASNDLDVTQIKVVTENGVVYLMGIVPPDEAQSAIELASDTDGVERVVKIFSYIRISKS